MVWYCGRLQLYREDGGGTSAELALLRSAGD